MKTSHTMKKLSQRGDILHGMAIIIFNFQLRFFRNKACSPRPYQ